MSKCDLIQSFSSKQPWEEYYVGFDFKNVVSTGAVIEDAVITVKDMKGNDVTSDFTDVGYQKIISPIVYFWVKGGENKKTYKITCKATCDDSEHYEADAMFPVREK
jgi:hypothetical protein